MRINPIVAKELKTKMRGWKAPVLMTVYTGFLGLIIFLNFYSSKVIASADAPSFSPSMAVGAYNILAIFQFLLLIFITPALTAGIISGERERQTLDLLLCSKLSSFSIITGKILVSIAHVLLLVFASLPIMGTVFLYGGIRISDMLMLLLFYIVTALMLGSMGTFFSAIFKKSSVSMIITYITVVIILLGTVIARNIWASSYMHYNSGKVPDTLHSMYFLFSNPMYGFTTLLDGTDRGIGALREIFRMTNNSMQSVNAAYPVLFGMEIKPWILNITFFVVISIIFLLLAIFKIKPVKRSWFKRGHKNHLPVGQTVKEQITAE